MMSKKLTILAMALFLFKNSALQACSCQTYGLSTKQKYLLGSFYLVSTIVAAPVIAPMSAITSLLALTAAAQAPVLSVAATLLPTTVAGKAALGLLLAQWTRPFIFLTPQEKLKALEQEEKLKTLTIKKDFISCLKAQKAQSIKNSDNIPAPCLGTAFAYAVAKGMPEMQERLRAFNNDTCFCT